jgi:hypothetical protein
MEGLSEGLTGVEMVIPYICATSACQVTSQKDTLAVSGWPGPAGNACDTCVSVATTGFTAGGQKSKMQSVHHSSVGKG